MPGSQRYALDTSFLLYHYHNPGAATKAIVSRGALNLTTASETLYTLCRTDGLDRALKFVDRVYRETQLIPSERLVGFAGQFKCLYPISLADSWVLATGKALQIPALFAQRERELVAHLDAISKHVTIQFLDEILPKT